jgi:hypothetical protein
MLSRIEVRAGGALPATPVKVAALVQPHGCMTIVARRATTYFRLFRLIADLENTKGRPDCVSRAPSAIPWLMPGDRFKPRWDRKSGVGISSFSPQLLKGHSVVGEAMVHLNQRNHWSFSMRILLACAFIVAASVELGGCFQNAIIIYPTETTWPHAPTHPPLK